MPKIVSIHSSGSGRPPQHHQAATQKPLAPSYYPSKLTTVIGFDELLDLLRYAADGAKAQHPEEARKFTRRANEVAEALWQEEEASFLPGGDA